MLASSQFGLSETSERTVEFNVLNEFAAYLWKNSHRILTVISPTQIEEDRLGFDDIIEGLPPGRILVFQFKRPKEMVRPRDRVKFTLNTQQLNRLAANFPRRNEAYIVLAPFPRNRQVVNHRRRLLTMTIGLDIHDIPNLRKTTQKTRTVRVHTHATLHGIPPVEIADPRRYEPVSRVQTLDKLGYLATANEVGHEITDRKVKSDKSKKIGVRKLYYLHVSQPTQQSD